MACQELERSVAAQALEAAKSVLQHLRKWAFQLKSRHEHKPRELSQLYGSVRRIRDRLSHGMEAYGSPVEVNLDDEDCNVLVSCLVFSLQGVGTRLSYGKDLDARDRSWLEDKRRSLFDLAVELATEEVKIIPSPGTTKQPVALVRMVMDRVRRKVRAGVMTGHWTRQRTGPEPAHETQTEARTDVDSSAAGLEPGLNEAQNQGDQGDQGNQGNQGNQEDLGGLEELEEALTLDARLLRDARLRTMVVLDMRAMERAQAAKDYRLAAVHLCSVCEAVVVDVALVRHDEIKLQGSPDTWRLDEVIGTLLGERFTTGDRASLYHLVACRTLVRPSIQLQSPVVVTRTTLEGMVEFVQRLLIALGVSSTPTPRAKK